MPGYLDNFMMCSRRNKPVIQAVVFLGLVGALGYCVFLYNTMTFKLERSDRQLKKYIKHQQSLSAQLQVVYEHRARLEKTFEKEKSEHKKTKTELDRSKREYLVNMTRTKHETRNRFNSLETQHRMLKAQQEQLQTEYSRLQQQHARLSAEHHQVHQQHVKSYKDLKEQTKNEITGLEEQIKTLKQQAASLRERVAEKEEDSTYYRNLHNKVLEETQRYKSAVASLNQQLKQHKKILQRYLDKPKKTNEPELSHRRPDADKARAADTRPLVTQAKLGLTQASAKPMQLDDQSRGEGRPPPAKRDEQESEEEAEDDEDEEQQRPGQSQPQKTAAPTIVQHPQPQNRSAGMNRPDLSRGQQNPALQHQKEPGAQSHDPVQKKAGAVRQVIPKPLTTKGSVQTTKSHSDEADGEPKADADDEQQTEEENVQRYLSQNLEDKMRNTANQQPDQQAAPVQPAESVRSNQQPDQQAVPVQPAESVRYYQQSDIKHGAPVQPAESVRSHQQSDQHGAPVQPVESVRSHQQTDQLAAPVQSIETIKSHQQILQQAAAAQSQETIKFNQQTDKHVAPVQPVATVKSETKSAPTEGALPKQQQKDGLSQLHPNMGQIRPPLDRAEQSQRLRQLHPNMGQINPPPGRANALESRNLSAVGAKPKDGGKSVEGAAAKEAGKDVRPIESDKLHFRKRKVDFKETLVETGPKQPDGGEQYRRPIPRPGRAVKRKSGDEDSENIEPNDHEQKSEHAQEEDNDNEAGEENIDKPHVPQGPDDGLDAGQPDIVPVKHARPQQSYKDGDDEQNEDGGEEESENEQQPAERQHIRGLR